MVECFKLVTAKLFLRLKATYIRISPYITKRKPFIGLSVLLVLILIAATIFAAIMLAFTYPFRGLILKAPLYMRVYPSEAKESYVQTFPVKCKLLLI
jgi:hypothetical protein